MGSTVDGKKKEDGNTERRKRNKKTRGYRERDKESMKSQG